MTQGLRYEQKCMLCNAELAVEVIAGVRLGRACYDRAMAIAAEAKVPIERSVEFTRAGGIVCVTCGGELQVDDERLDIRCPNGHPVELVTNAERKPPRAHKPYKKAAYQPKPCVGCGQTFQPTGGRDTRCPTCKGGARG